MYRRVIVLTMLIIQLVWCSFSSALNFIRSRSVLMIHVFHFASVSKQLICRDLNLFQMELPKKFKSNLESDRSLLNGIFIV